MKHSILLSFVLLLSSCKSIREFTITGEPGTVIKRPDLTEVGTIGNDGKLTVEFYKYQYEPFWVAYPKDQEKGIAFGLDCDDFDLYHKTSIRSAIPTLIGSALAIGCAVSGATTPALIGTAIAIGPGIIPSVCVTSASNYNDGYEYNYRYSERQIPNDDLVFTKTDLQESNSAPQTTPNTVSQKFQDVLQNQTTTSQKSQDVVLQKSSSALSSLIIKESNKTIQGKYSGSGSISLNNNEIKKFSKLLVEITCSNETTALVDIYDDSGMHFFDEKLEYTFKEESDGGFTLTNSSIKTATITISSKDELTLIHPNIEIQGDAYQLSVKAIKQ